MIKKSLLLLCTLLLCGGLASATTCVSTTVSSTGVVDADSLTWAGGTITANIILPSSVANFNNLTCDNGGTLLASYTTTLDSSGAFSFSVPSNTHILAPGSQWAFTVCPNALRGCYTLAVTISGTSQNITTTINNVLPGPRFTIGTVLAYGYGTVELISTIPTGSFFYNTTTNFLLTYNGSAWNNLNSALATNSAGNLVNTATLVRDEFCGNTPATTTTIGQLGWDSTVVVAGTNPVAAAASVANHPCLITLTTDTTATHGVYVSLGHAVGTLFPGASTNWQSEHIAEINQIATGSYRIGFGTVDSATAIPTNGIYFRFLQGTDTFINACYDVTGTETCTATAVTPTAADYVDFFMNSTVTGAVSFTVTDVTTPATSTVTLCPSGCTAAATAPTVVLSPMFSIVETGSAVADILTADYFAFQQSVTR